MESIGGEESIPWQRISRGSYPRFSRSFVTPEGVDVVESRRLGGVFHSFEREESDGQITRKMTKDTSRDVADDLSPPDIEAMIPFANIGLAEITLMDLGKGDDLLLPRIALNSLELGKAVPYIDLGYDQDGNIGDISIKIREFSSNNSLPSENNLLAELTGAVPSKSYKEYLQDFAAIYRIDESYDPKLTFNEEDQRSIAEITQNPEFNKVRDEFAAEILDAFQGIPPSVIGRVLGEIMNETMLIFPSLDPNSEIPTHDDVRERFGTALRATLKTLCQRYENKKNAPTKYDIKLSKEKEGEQWKMSVVEEIEDIKDYEKGMKPLFEQDMEFEKQLQFENYGVTLEKGEERYTAHIVRYDFAGKIIAQVRVDLPERIKVDEIAAGMKSTSFKEFRQSLASFDVKLDDSPLVTAA